jgi:hypothetical protein
MMDMWYNAKERWEHLFGWGHDYEMSHMPATVIAERIGQDKFRRYFKFAFVRNPWDRLVSTYFKQDLITKSLLNFDQDFTNFVYQLDEIWRSLDEVKHIHKSHLIPQTNIIYNDDDELMIDFLGRFESFQKDVEEIRERLKITKQTSITNSTVHKPYQRYYNEETVEIVRRLYERDVRFFNYEFT